MSGRPDFDAVANLIQARLAAGEPARVEVVQLEGGERKVRWGVDSVPIKLECHSPAHARQLADTFDENAWLPSVAALLRGAADFADPGGGGIQ